MPIKEEPIKIEFQYEQEDAKTSDGTLDVEYFSEMNEGEEKKYLRVCPRGSDSPHIFEVDFFVEVVDFLREKGVIGEVSPKGEVATVAASYLPLPKIKTTNGKVEMPGGLITPVVEKQFYSSLPAFTNNEEIEKPLSSVAIKVPQAVGVKVVAPTIISADTPAEGQIITRPVIRTKIGANEDAMNSLIESKRQRQVNPEKMIKRREAVNEI